MTGMSPEENELLKRTAVLAEENNKILLSMKRSMRLSRIMSLAYWVLIIGSAVGAYYLIQPYMQAITGAYGGATSFGDNMKGVIDNFNQMTQ